MYNPGQELSSIAFDKIIGGALNAVTTAQNNSSMTTVNFIKSVGFVNDDNGNTVKPIYVDFKYPKEIMPYQPASKATAFVKVENGGSGYDKENISDKYNVGGADIVIDLQTSAEGVITGVSILSGAEKVKGETELTLTAKNGELTGTGARLILVEVPEKPAEAAKYQDMTLQVPILTMLPIPFIRVESTDIELNVKINSINSKEDSSDTKADASVTAKAGYKGFGVNASVELNASISHQKKSSEKEEVKKEYSLNIKIHAVQDEMPAGLSRVLDILEESIVPKQSGALAGI